MTVEPRRRSAPDPLIATLARIVRQIDARHQEAEARRRASMRLVEQPKEDEAA